MNGAPTASTSTTANSAPTNASHPRRERLDHAGRIDVDLCGHAPTNGCHHCRDDVDRQRRHRHPRHRGCARAASRRSSSSSASVSRRLDLEQHVDVCRLGEQARGAAATLLRWLSIRVSRSVSLLGHVLGELIEPGHGAEVVERDRSTVSEPGRRHLDHDRRPPAAVVSSGSTLGRVVDGRRTPPCRPAAVTVGRYAVDGGADVVRRQRGPRLDRDVAVASGPRPRAGRRARRGRARGRTVPRRRLDPGAALRRRSGIGGGWRFRSGAGRVRGRGHGHPSARPPAVVVIAAAGAAARPMCGRHDYGRRRGGPDGWCLDVVPMLPMAVRRRRRRRGSRSFGCTGRRRIASAPWHKP